MKLRVVVLGAGFGGLELSTMLSEALADRLDLTLIDKNDSFVFGYSKLDVMFGRKNPDAVRLAYRNIVKPGVRFRREEITAIAPDARRDPPPSSSARQRRAKPRCCCTTISPHAVCATPSRSAWSCRSASRSLRRLQPPGHCSPPSPSGVSPLSPIGFL